MSHHHSHTLRDIRHLTGKIFWSLLTVVVLFVTIRWGTNFGPVGEGVRLVVGSIVLLYLPGYRITQAAWYGESLDLLEQTALSFAFSLSVVPLVVFYLNLLGVAITQSMVLLVVVAILVLTMGRSILRK